MDELISVEMKINGTNVEFIGNIEEYYIVGIHCYMDKKEHSTWKTYSHVGNEQAKFIRMILEQCGMEEGYITEYSKKVMSCFTNRIECILK